MVHWSWHNLRAWGGASYGESLDGNRHLIPAHMGGGQRTFQNLKLTFPVNFKMKKNEFSPEVVTNCELTAIPIFNIIVPRSLEGAYPQRRESAVDHDQRCGQALNTKP